MLKGTLRLRSGQLEVAPFSSLASCLGFSLERKGIVLCKLVEGDRLASGEPLDIFRNPARLAFAIEPVQIEQCISRPRRHTRGQHGFPEFCRWQIHVANLPSHNSRNLFSDLR